MAAPKISAPGRMINVGRGSLHVQDEGSGGPVVVLEAGIAATSLSWSLVQPRVAAFARVISYDRAGFGWSDAPAGNGTAMDAAQSLHELLRAMGVERPVILVGHSFGGLIVRVFQQLFGDRVAGMVLVDPAVREEWRTGSGKLLRGAALSRRGALLARLGIVSLALRMLASGGSRVPRLLAKASAADGAGVADRLVREVRKMPQEHWPAIAMHWSHPRSFETMAKNLENLPLSVSQVDESASLGDLPVIVLSARPTPEHATDAAKSTRGENVVVAGSGHWILLDQPDVVVEAIRKVCA